MQPFQFSNHGSFRCDTQVKILAGTGVFISITCYKTVLVKSGVKEIFFQIFFHFCKIYIVIMYGYLV